MRITIVFILLNLYYSPAIHAQDPHDEPDHPKGNAGTQYEALPFYNEACELYAKGRIEKAKQSLYEAINTSFALTEAHLFLADIYYEQGVLDSAFFFYNSGIDFAIEQKPHYYFRLFETGIKVGKYDMVHHNLKHFKKLYGKQTDLTRYEDEYPYTYADYEVYFHQIKSLYSPELWRPRAELAGIIKGDSWVRSNATNKRYRLVGNEIHVLDNDGKISSTIKNAPTGMITPFMTADGNHLVFAFEENNERYLFSASCDGKHFSTPKKLPNSVNMGSWSSDAFITTDGKQMYYTSNVNGNKDLFVANIDLSSNTATSISPLLRVNTPADECSPYWDEQNQVFYFSSNKQMGFGGFDIYYCEDFETVNNMLYPFNSINAGSPINSYHDQAAFGMEHELQLVQTNKSIVRMYSPLAEEGIDYEIRFISYPQRDDE